MRARARLLGHPIHPMLIVFPLGLLTTAVILDVLHLFRGGTLSAEMAFWLIAAGVIGGLAAAVFGLIDWLGIPGGTRARRVGLLHGLGNVVVVALFAGSWLLRREAPTDPGTLALVLSFAGGALAMVTGWLGGELVDRLGVGVDEGAHVNASSSLSGEPVTPGARAGTGAA
ncbi:MAG: DUF2231 domain-containing protein [Gemmatimonadaceae bacterium]